MTVLSMVQQVAYLLDVEQITSVVAGGLPSEQINTAQLLHLANQEGVELARRHPWQALTKEKTFTSLAQETQTSFIATDLDRFLNETFFNRTRKRRIIGPLNVEEWQAQKSITASTLTEAFRIRGDACLITPVPPAGDTYSYEYISNQWCKSSGGTGQSSWQNDTDIGILSENLMQLGIIWRWLSLRGQDYAEQFATYERQVAQAIMRDGARRTLNFANSDRLYDTARYPNVPEGSWPL